MSSSSRMKDNIRKEGGVKAICRLLKGNLFANLTNQKLAIKSLRSLASNNRFNKEVMNEMAMIEVFRRWVLGRLYAIRKLFKASMS